MDCLPNEEAQKLIREILSNGSVIFPDHARKQMADRNYTVPDVKYILKTGNVTGSEKHKNTYRYNVHGEDLEGHPGIVVTAVVSKAKMVIVTVKGGV